MKFNQYTGTSSLNILFFVSNKASLHTLNAFLVLFLETRVRFLLGGAHGEFRFLPPPGFAPCSEALLPRVKLKVEPCHRYILDHRDGKQEIIGPLVPFTPVTFTPTPVDVSKVKISIGKQFIVLCLTYYYTCYF